MLNMWHHSHITITSPQCSYAKIWLSTGLTLELGDACMGALGYHWTIDMKITEIWIKMHQISFNNVVYKMSAIIFSTDISTGCSFSFQVMCLSETPTRALGSSRPCARSYVSVMTTQRSWTSWHVSTTTWPTSLSRATRGDLCRAKSRCPASWVCLPRSCTSRRSESCHAWWYWVWFYFVYGLLLVKILSEDRERL